MKCKATRGGFQDTAKPQNWSTCGVREIWFPPFLLEDAESIARLRSDLPFLERLGEELTRPVIPQSAAIDYTPSQYLCEFIKKCGYDGVIYTETP